MFYFGFCCCGCSCCFFFLSVFVCEITATYVSHNWIYRVQLELHIIFDNYSAIKLKQLNLMEWYGYFYAITWPIKSLLYLMCGYSHFSGWNSWNSWSSWSSCNRNAERKLPGRELKIDFAPVATAICCNLFRLTLEYVHDCADMRNYFPLNFANISLIICLNFSCIDKSF